jgi:hypothetical protein
MAGGETPRGARETRQAQSRRAAAQARQRTLRLRYMGGGLVALLLVFGAGAYYVSARSSAPATTATPVQPGANIDSVSCQAEMLAYHIHAALIMYDNGQRVTLPADVGIPINAAINQNGQNYCLYSLHTHDSDHAAGIIHVESPTQGTYTLGQFLDIWHYTALWDKQGTLAAANKISVDGSFADAVRGAKQGAVHAYVDGKPVSSFRDITLTAHKVITVELGAPLVKPTTSVTFPAGE